ncbi:MAG: molybdopterin biosynthesis protein [Chloroflexota bacterium]|nr:molybdopterin biosynthesis protein [Chloroflexota bacterium]
MTIYLHDIPLEKAKKRLHNALKQAGLWSRLGLETIPLDEHALGRTLAEPIWAKISSPHYHASAMDGFAVRACDTEGALPTSPLELAYGPQVAYVDTGDPLPGWANAVIPIENIEALDAEGEISPDTRHPYALRIRAAVPPWSHIRPMGEDMVATQLVLPAGHTLRPPDLGAIAGCGHGSVKVARRPRVAIIPTGTELVPIGASVASGDIIEYNSTVMAAQVNSWGGRAKRGEIVSDDFEKIRARVAEAAVNHDLILLIAGSSAGSEDFSASVVDSLGELLVHGIAVRPGHPVILGLIAGREAEKPPQAKRAADPDLNPQPPTPIIGVPGYPVSAALTGEIFVEPMIARWLGRRPSEPLEVEATLTRKLVSPAGDDDYVRVAVGKVGVRTLAAPLARGSGIITSLVRADGIVIVPSGSQGMAAGENVHVRLYRSPKEIERTIFIIGSHDITLDVMMQFLAARDRRVASANVGSIGGLVALRRGEAHLAGSHLLDPDTGEYNLSYIRKYLPDTPVRVISLVRREQGLILTQGNPKGIQSLGDLTNPEVRFTNRQRGAGTRVLLDYHLKKLGIQSEEINGYSHQEYTHLNVAAAVASGRADCGLGIAAAAHALDLDFVPLFQERYDLIIPQEFVDQDLLAPLMDVLADPDFRAMVASLPGYDLSPMGEVVAEME